MGGWSKGLWSADRLAMGTGLRGLGRGMIGAAKRARWSPRSDRGGKSGLPRARCWVTPRRREATESATESRPPTSPVSIGDGQG